MAVLGCLETAFPGSKLDLENGVVAGVLRHDALFHTLRIRESPMVELYLSTGQLDHFELRTDFTTSFWGDAGYVTASNDAALQAFWMDDIVVSGLDELEQLANASSVGWHMALGMQRLTMIPNSKRVMVNDLTTMLRAGLALSERSYRWASDCKRWLNELPGSIENRADHIELNVQSFVIEYRRIPVAGRFQRRRTRDSGIAPGIHLQLAASPRGMVKLDSLDVAAIRRSCGDYVDDIFIHQGQLLATVPWFRNALIVMNRAQEVSMVIRQMCGAFADGPQDPYR
jgi:hypothetical protein